LFNDRDSYEIGLRELLVYFKGGYCFSDLDKNPNCYALNLAGGLKND
jgi:hypothetical protein